MDNIRKVPEIRFKGFDYEWEEEFLKDNVDFYSGLTYKPSDVSKKSSNNVLVIRSSNIKNGKFLLSNDDVYVKEEALKSTETEMNDIVVVVRNGSRSLIGKHGIINKSLRKATVGAFMTGIRAYRFNFINILLDTNAFKKQINDNIGATINQITKSTFNSMSFYFPNSDEQSQIGSFFKNLDEKLELEKEKHEKLINFRKAMLEDMFPKEGKKVPKVRFDGFDDEWKETKISSIATIKAGGDINKEKLLKSGKYPVYANSSSKENSVIGYYNDYIIKGPAVTLTARGEIGIPIARESNFTPVVRLLSLKFRNSDNIHFMENSLKRITFLSETTGVPQLTAISMEKYYFKIPNSYKEQTQIGNFFKNLDEKIELSERKIKKIENFKKAMLDKMFV